MNKTENKNHILGVMAALITNIIFGFSFMFSKKALEIAHPVVIAAVRFTAAFLAMNILLLFHMQKVNFKGKNISKLLLMALSQPICYFVLEIYGIKYTSSAISGLIIALVPVVVVIISMLFLKEKPTIMQILCTVVSLVGVAAVAILSDDGGKNHFLGILLLFGAAISNAVFNVLSRSESDKFSPFERTYFMFLIGAVGYNIIAFCVLGRRYITELATALAYADFWISICYLALISSVGAFLLYNFATSKINAVEAASFSNIITVVSVLAGVFILGEPFSSAQFLWCIPIILGVWGVNLKKS